MRTDKINNKDYVEVRLNMMFLSR